MAPRLTIGLPVYNGALFLEQTVRSLLEQTWTDFRLIIGDNASTDATGEIGRSLASEDPRVEYVCNERNLGLARNYNALFQRARGEFFKWAPADDYYDPRYLERCIAALDADPGTVLAYPRTQFVDPDGRPLSISDPGWDLQSDDPGERLRFTIEANHWVNSIIGVIRTEALARTHLHPPHSAGDYVILGELCVQGKFVEVPEVLFFRRLHPGSSSQIGNDRVRMVDWMVGPEGGLYWPTWQRNLRHLRTVTTAPLPIRSRLKLLGVLGRACIRRRSALMQELAGVGGALFTRSARGRS